MKTRHELQLMKWN